MTYEEKKKEIQSHKDYKPSGRFNQVAFYAMDRGISILDEKAIRALVMPLYINPLPGERRFKEGSKTVEKHFKHSLKFYQREFGQFFIKDVLDIN